jgi:hypothetical protein
MDLSNVIKYFLFVTNVIIFSMGLAVFSCSIWVLVDKPNFISTFSKVSQEFPSLPLEMEVSLYTSAAVILLVSSSLLILVSFCGCFGAVRENFTALVVFFIMVLVILILVVVGTVLATSDDLDEKIKIPLTTSLRRYNDQPKFLWNFGINSAWNQMQMDWKCCGLENVTDWQQAGDADFPEGFNKPIGCCVFLRNGSEISEENEVQQCRESAEGPDSDKYWFEGCYDEIKQVIESNQDALTGVAIGTSLFMFINMQFSFAMIVVLNRKTESSTVH